jgi:hypothetical protein
VVPRDLVTKVDFSVCDSPDNELCFFQKGNPKAQVVVANVDPARGAIGSATLTIGQWVKRP